MKALWVRAATSPQPTDLIVGTLVCVAVAVLCALLQMARTELSRRLERHRRLLAAAQLLPPPQAAPGVSALAQPNPNNHVHARRPSGRVTGLAGAPTRPAESPYPWGAITSPRGSSTYTYNPRPNQWSEKNTIALCHTSPVNHADDTR